MLKSRLKWNYPPNTNDIIIFVSYCAISLFFLRYYLYQVNTDAVIFISIAREYLHQGPYLGINSFWQPLFSWLLVPFLALSIKPVLACKILSLAIGLFSLLGVRSLSKKIGISQRNTYFILYCSAPLIAWFALNIITADLLSACILIFYLNILFSGSYPDKIYKAFYCGLLGALSGLARDYNLSFFIPHFIIINLIYYINQADPIIKKKIARNCLVGLSTAILISMAWVGVKGYKYRQLIILPTASYNLELVKPGSPGNQINYMGFIRPKNDLETYNTEEYIDRGLSIMRWNPLRSPQDLLFEIKIIKKNIIKYFGWISGYPLIFFGLIYITAAFFGITGKRPGIQPSLIFVTVVLFPLGYFCTLIHERYIQFNCLLLIIAGGWGLDHLLEHDLFKSKKAIILLITLFIFTALRPVKNLNDNKDSGKEFYELSREFNAHQKLKGKNIASQYGSWQEGMFVSFFSEAKFFGQSQSDISDHGLRQELIRHNIDYYLVKEKLQNDPEILSLEATSGSLHLYRVIK